MGKFDRMGIEELKRELATAKGIGKPVLKAIAGLGTIEAAELIGERARAATKGSETQAFCEILAQMGAVGAPTLIGILRHGNAYEDGHEKAERALRSLGNEAVPAAREAVREIFATTESWVAELESTVVLLDDPALCAPALARLLAGWSARLPGGERIPDEVEQALSTQSAFVERLLPTMQPEVRTWREAWRQSSLRASSYTMALRPLWQYLKEHAALDPELHSALDRCRILDSNSL